MSSFGDYELIPNLDEYADIIYKSFITKDNRESSSSKSNLLDYKKRLSLTHAHYPLNAHLFQLYSFKYIITKQKKTLEVLSLEDREDFKRNLRQLEDAETAAFRYSFLRPYCFDSERDNSYQKYARNLPDLESNDNFRWYPNGIFVVRADADGKEIPVFALLNVENPKYSHGTRIPDISVSLDANIGTILWLRRVGTLVVKDDINLREAYYQQAGEFTMQSVNIKDPENSLLGNFLLTDKDMLSVGFSTPFWDVGLDKKNKYQPKYIEIAWRKSSENNSFQYDFITKRLVSKNKPVKLIKDRNNPLEVYNFSKTMEQEIEDPETKTLENIQTDQYNLFVEIRNAAVLSLRSYLYKVSEGRDDLLSDFKTFLSKINTIVYMHPIASSDVFGITGSCMDLNFTIGQNDIEKKSNVNKGVFATNPMTVNILAEKEGKISAYERMFSDGIKSVAHSAFTPIISEKAFPATVTHYNVLWVDLIMAPYSALEFSYKEFTEEIPTSREYFAKCMANSINFYHQVVIRKDPDNARKDIGTTTDLSEIKNLGVRTAETKLGYYKPTDEYSIYTTYGYIDNISYKGKEYNNVKIETNLLVSGAIIPSDHTEDPSVASILGDTKLRSYNKLGVPMVEVMSSPCKIGKYITMTVEELKKRIGETYDPPTKTDKILEEIQKEKRNIHK